MSESSKAVFLSYASQDADAAKRICDALRQAGVEVWFDQSELRGGDAWDHKIRTQIKECALFIPIISANTQSRAEGYFRLEWRLADRRTELMGKSKAFLVPVCVDETSDAEADVPDSFLAVQWLRFAGGAVTPAFGERIKELLAGEPAGAALRRDRPEDSQRKSAPIIVSAVRRLPRWFRLVLAIALLVAVAIWERSHRSEPGTPSASSWRCSGRS